MLRTTGALTAALLTLGCALGCSGRHAGESNDELDEGIVVEDGGDERASGDEAASGSADASTGEGSGGGGEAEGSDSEGAATKFDLAPLPDAGFGACGTDDYEFSMLWVANSPASTVSKIDTRGLVELARYRTHAGSGNPSRTSVNLRGDVAVLNRSGSVIKIATRESDCIDANQDGTLQTSTGSDDVLAWGQDECLLWSHALDFAGSPNAGPRALAWDPGDSDAGCPGQGARLWVGYLDSLTDTAWVVRLDGETGELLDQVAIPDWGDSSDYSPYGGASDAQGNFWLLGKYPKSVVRIGSKSLSVTRFANPAAGFIGYYGMAIDGQGRPWAASWGAAQLWRLDPATKLWSKFWTSEHYVFRGLAIDQQGNAWIAANGPCGLVQVDIEAGQIVDDAIELPGCSTPVGVSVDVDGYVWVVDQGGGRAYRVDPDTYATVTVEGLIGPYTYSDMTGAGLGLVVSPQG